MLATASAYYQCPQLRQRQSALDRSSADIAAKVWLVIVPREPSSTETFAIVF